MDEREESFVGEGLLEGGLGLEVEVGLGVFVAIVVVELSVIYHGWVVIFQSAGMSIAFLGIVKSIVFCDFWTKLWAVVCVECSRSPMFQLDLMFS